MLAMPQCQWPCLILFASATSCMHCNILLTYCITCCNQGPLQVKHVAFWSSVCVACNSRLTSTMQISAILSSMALLRSSSARRNCGTCGNWYMSDLVGLVLQNFTHCCVCVLCRSLACQTCELGFLCWYCPSFSSLERVSRADGHEYRKIHSLLPVLHTRLSTIHWIVSVMSPSFHIKRACSSSCHEVSVWFSSLAWSP